MANRRVTTACPFFTISVALHRRKNSKPFRRRTIVKSIADLLPAA
jgi:hypothetical protein